MLEGLVRQKLFQMGELGGGSKHAWGPANETGDMNGLSEFKLEPVRQRACVFGAIGLLLGRWFGQWGVTLLLQSLVRWNSIEKHD